MKAHAWNLLRFVSVLTLAGWLPTPRLSAQTPAELSIQPYAGLTITGAVGTVYSIEYVTDLAQSNTPTAWRCVEYLQLPASPYLWADKSAPATGKRFYRAVVFPAPTNMVFIPPGTFRMGSPTDEMGRDSDEGPQTAVTISRGYWMGKYEVTQGEYEAVMGSNPSWFNGDGQFWDESCQCFTNKDLTELNRPVEQVSWQDATDFCAVLTQRERSAGRLPSTWEYRLPAEAEWEYAARAGTSTRFSHGDDLDYSQLGDHAWFQSNSEARTHTVGLKKANAWGLHDISGNLLEWCLDWNTGALPGGSVIDPWGPTSGSQKVARGGTWSVDGRSCRTAHQAAYPPDFGSYYIGFRLVLTEIR